MKNKRNAHSLIELIFVMVILGILAAVVIPKLAVTRNDAKGSVIATRLGNCITLAGKSYLQNMAFNLNEPDCKRVTQDYSCFIITPDNASGILNVKDSNDTSEICLNAQTKALENKLSSKNGINHEF